MNGQAPLFFSVSRWETFQGEVKRKAGGPDWVAPWFKVYHRLLDDFDFSNLPESDRFLWLGILCLAARTRNKIRADAKYLQHQLRTKLPIPLGIFASFGWIAWDDTNASRIVPESFAKNSAPEERRGEEIREEPPLTSPPTRTTPKRKATAERPPHVTETTWTDFVSLRRTKRAPLTETALRGIEREAAKAGLGLEEALALCCQRGWQGLKAEWVTQGGDNGAGRTGSTGLTATMERLLAKERASGQRERCDDRWPDSGLLPGRTQG